MFVYIILFILFITIILIIVYSYYIITTLNKKILDLQEMYIDNEEYIDQLEKRNDKNIKMVKLITEKLKLLDKYNIVSSNY